MNWKLKALAQNVIALLPSFASYKAYYYVQRRWGGLRNPDPFSGLRVGAATWRHLKEIDFHPKDRVFFEVGTGRTPMSALGFWLLGAKKTITCDLNPYVREDLTLNCVRHIVGHLGEVRAILGPELDESRLASLRELVASKACQLEHILALACIDYRAPFDARETNLPDSSIDVHTSYTVLEHIPGPVIAGILSEARRILADDGIAIHLIDYSDHFSHDDQSLHWLHFLRYSELPWKLIAGNRYMYMNRLRHDDQLAIGNSSNLLTTTLAVARDTDFEARLADGTIRLGKRFSGKSTDVLAVQSAWVSYRRHSINDGQ